jgi:AAA domain
VSDYELTPEQENDLLRFWAGAKTARTILESAELDWLIDGWLATSATMVTGSPESGKSSLVASMAAAVSRRESWLGSDVSTSRTGPVAVVVTDPSDATQWAKKACDLGVVDDWEVIEFAPERWESIEDLATYMDCPLLVFDNITGALDGPINDADPTAILRPLGKIVGAGTPVVAIAHSGKGGSKDPMGPTAYKAWRRHGIHVSGSGDRRTLTRRGNLGSFPDVVVHGTANGAAVEYRLAGGDSKPNRSVQRMDDNAVIADWVVENCQRIGVNQAGKRVAEKFGGTGGSRTFSLKTGPLSKMLKRTGEGGSTTWARIK